MEWQISIIESLNGWDATATKGCCRVSKHYAGRGGNSLAHVHTLFKRYLKGLDREVQRALDGGTISYGRR